MKKILTLLATALLTISCVFGLTACGNEASIKIGAQTDTTGYTFATYLKGTEAKAYANPSLALIDLKNGSLDYVVVDKAVAINLCNNNNDVKYIDIALTGSEYFAMGVNKNKTDIKAQLNAFLEENADTVNAIKAKYLTGDSDNFVGVQSAVKGASSNQLIVATNAEYAPFEYIEGDKYYGIDMEIIKLFADNIGKELVIDNMAFESVVTAVQQGTADIAAAALTVTEDRSESVDFANNYYENAQVVVCLKTNEALDECETVMDILAVLCANK